MTRAWDSARMPATVWARVRPSGRSRRVPSIATTCAPALATARACRSVGVMKTPSWPSFQSPMTGTSTAARVNWMSARPWTRTAAAPPMTAEAATWAGGARVPHGLAGVRLAGDDQLGAEGFEALGGQDHGACSLWWSWFGRADWCGQLRTRLAAPTMAAVLPRAARQHRQAARAGQQFGPRAAFHGRPPELAGVGQARRTPPRLRGPGCWRGRPRPARRPRRRCRWPRLAAASPSCASAKTARVSGTSGDPPRRRYASRMAGPGGNRLNVARPAADARQRPPVGVRVRRRDVAHVAAHVPVAQDRTAGQHETAADAGAEGHQQRTRRPGSRPASTPRRAHGRGRRSRRRTAAGARPSRPASPRSAPSRPSRGSRRSRKPRRPRPASITPAEPTPTPDTSRARLPEPAP